MALETVILAPVTLLGIVLVVAFGRATIAHGAVEAAARDAARQASLSRTVDDAQNSARTSALAALRRGDLRCAPQVDVNADGLNREPGERAVVTVTVVCTVDLADIALPGVPGSTTLRATFTSPIDPYRA
ncbi:TadE/TadG family type IV pilus assembly protein [Actinomadura rayongensis]|nr:TadE/TadG family type IV pilus assembly protein [Actinomadura rayongensis]